MTPIELHLSNYLAQPNVPAKLQEAMRYAVLGGGKRLRPLLVYAVGESFGADPEKLHAPAAAVEFMHCYSLVHDDLPAMDNDDFRRGKPSCHKAFDEATAILVGDALQSLAFEILDHIEMVHILARAVGAAGMVGGQLLDIEKSADLKQLHLLKTAKLFEAAALMGAVAANCTETEKKQISEFALNAGIAFQIKDDLHDGDTTLELSPYLAALNNTRIEKKPLLDWWQLALK